MEDVAHGGWTATVLDEMLGLVATMHGVITVTAHLEVDYLRPVPMEHDLVFSGRVVSREGRRWHIAGELSLDGDDEVLVRGSGVWVERDRERHLQAMADWLASTKGPASSGG
jgi:acyl-coenzyme A thioesterase PaaI-like protein